MNSMYFRTKHTWKCPFTFESISDQAHNLTHQMPMCVFFTRMISKFYDRSPKKFVAVHPRSNWSFAVAVQPKILTTEVNGQSIGRSFGPLSIQYVTHTVVNQKWHFKVIGKYDKICSVKWAKFFEQIKIHHSLLSTRKDTISIFYKK